MNEFTRRLRALALTDGETRPRAQMTDSKIEDNVATLRLYDVIDSWGEWWGISAKEFTDKLDALPSTITEIRLRINSPGGDVFDGIAIMNALRAHDAHVVAIVDGIAASAASVVACGVDELVMARNSELMIHDAWGLCVGNADDMHKTAAELDHFSDNIASVYADKAGGGVEKWRAAMQAESWFSADEAVTAGLADSVDRADTATTDAKNSFDLSIYKYSGRANAPAPRAAMPGMPEHEFTDPDGDGYCDACVMQDAAGGCTARCGMTEALHSLTNIPPAPAETGADTSDGAENAIDARSTAKFRLLVASTRT